MLKKYFLFLLFLLCLNVYSQSLKVITINVWSGLDYKGIIKMGEYESEEKAEKRFQFLVSQLKDINADIIFLQEVNPVKTYSSRIARLLGMDEVHQVCNGGIKIASLGFPTNLSEGITILARTKYNLEKTDAWKLSGMFGLYGDYFSTQFNETNFALVAKINVNGLPVYLVNVHTNSTPPDKPALRNYLEDLLLKNIISKEEYDDGLKEWAHKLKNRPCEFETLSEKLKDLPVGIPFILGGDFNIEPDDPHLVKLISENNLLNTQKESVESPFTWLPYKNINIGYSISDSGSSNEDKDAYKLMYRYYDLSPRTIDYLFLSNLFNEKCSKEYKIILDSLDGDVQASDHFGVYSEIDLSGISGKIKKETDYFTNINYSSIEPFPILMYDTDIGFGYGAKAFFMNLFDQNESIDLTAFNSTKGERWYRLAFSWPDLESRQGKIYPVAIDFSFDYDKMIKNGFYGIGKNSKYVDQEFYTKEPVEICLSASRGFTTKFVGQFGLRFKGASVYNFESTDKLKELVKSSSDSSAYFVSVFLNLRYDSRNSLINPSGGMVLQGEVETSGKINDDTEHGVDFSRYYFECQSYSILFYPKTVLALRFRLQNISCNNLPVQVLYSLGGNKTLRGFPQDRLIDKCSILFNGELRFPIYNRFTGIIGLDAGQVFPSFSDIDLSGWKMNPSVGLRFNLDNFIVRFDAGFSNETTGLYFNFGHIF